MISMLNEIHLTPKQQTFVDAFMESNDPYIAIDAVNRFEGEQKRKAVWKYMHDKNVANAIKQRQEQRKKDSIATSQQVMEFYTKAMNGEIKDQFGLDATLADRIKAANELAKRTVDLDNRLNGKPDAQIEIKLTWE